MRPIHLVELDRTRPAVVLTREAVRPHLARVTVAPITTRIRGLSTEVAVGTANGLDAAGVVHCDAITTIPVDRLGAPLGRVLPAQEPALAAAIAAAFDLEPPAP